MTWDSAVIGGSVTLGVKILWDWLTHRNGSSNGSAGEKNVAFWQLQYKDMEDRIVGRLRAEIEDAEERIKRSIHDRR